jgi:hypothetical protein
MSSRKSEWPVLYDTPVYQLLFRCGLKRVGTRDGRAVWDIRREAPKDWRQNPKSKEK